MNTRFNSNQRCPHEIYIKGLCGDCGARLDPDQESPSVSMVHSVPELKVSKEYAKEMGKADQKNLIRDRKLVLLVDLDHTLLHTTHETVRNLKDVHSFQLGPREPICYTKLRPFLGEFLERMSELYELHIFTFGCRVYAEKIASIIDPDKRFFGNRIMSRDESLDKAYKTSNLSNLFPCGDGMVCIIDDRADVWREAGNLIQVKPYNYFKTSISDGAMAPASYIEEDESFKRDVDQLEALLGLNDEDDDKGETSGEASDKCDDKKDGNHDRAEVGDLNDRCETDDKGEMSAVCGDEVSDSDNEPDAKRQKLADEEKSTDSEDDETGGSQDDPRDLDDDDDDHLLHLPLILGRIHEKWYMELDEQRRFLVEGESYKLPDIKDIIKKYLRKKH